MLKLVLLTTFCIFMVAKSQPTMDNELLSNENFRVARNTQQVQNAMHTAEKIVHGGLEVANKGVHLLGTAAKKAMSAGSTIAAAAAKGAITLL